MSFTIRSFDPKPADSRRGGAAARVVSLVVAAIAAIAIVLLPAAVASAQGYGTADGPKISDGTPSPGQTVEVVMGGFAPNTDVKIELHSDPVILGTFTSDPTGVVRASVTIPEGISGNHTIVAAGLSVAGQPVSVSVPVAIGPAVAGDSPLALTGANSRGMVALGTILLLVGTVATLAARKRMSDES